MNVFNSNCFSYHGRSKTFVAEASTLGPEFTIRYPYITIISARTSQAKDFVYMGKLQEAEEYDGELRGWEYISADGLKVHILND